MEDTAEKAKLREKAKAMYEKVSQSKNEVQKIRLNLNLITPENYDKKFGELRNFLFGEILTQEEALDADQKWEELGDNVNDEILTTIVQNIFRKAQVEKEYIIFYGDLCERMIKLELNLRGLNHSIQNMKVSAFRQKLFQVCKECFEKFFNEEEKTKMQSSIER